MPPLDPYASQYEPTPDTLPTYTQYSANPISTERGFSYPLSGPSFAGSQPFMPPQGIAAPMFLLKPRTSGFAIAALVLGVLGVILTLFDLLLDAGAALDHQDSASTDLIALLILALFCWTPALLAFIFGLIARGKIRKSAGQIKGAGKAYTGIILGCIGLSLPLIGVILFSFARF